MIGEPRYVFQVFLIPGVPSRAACATLRRLCAERLGEGAFEIEEVDVQAEPAQAVAHGILAIPTIVRREPAPVIRLIGDLSNEELTAQVLDLPSRTSAASR